MAIVFRCEHCGKRIEAPDQAGGKRGKCPACRNPVYVPGHVEEDEPLRLAPLDESEEQNRKSLLSETLQITENLLRERNAPEESKEETSVVPESDDMSFLDPVTRMDPAQLKAAIVRYLRLMADGSLEEGDALAEHLTLQGKPAKDILESIALGHLTEPDLANIPPHVLSGLVRHLRGQIGD